MNFLAGAPSVPEAARGLTRSFELLASTDWNSPKADIPTPQHRARFEVRLLELSQPF
jgi:hypothetical protein